MRTGSGTEVHVTATCAGPTEAIPGTYVTTMDGSPSASSAERPATVPARRRIAAPDPLSARALEATLARPPQDRFLLLADCTLRECARRLGVTHTRLGDVFAKATAYRRMSSVWAARLAGVIDATTEEVYLLFGVTDPAAAVSAPRRRARRIA